MICKVKQTIEKHKLLNNVKTVAVGVSGGADSMCLLHVLSSLKDEYGIILKAVHLNHNLRGEEALRDENFVRLWCEEKGIELKVFSRDIASLSQKMKIGEEECGRIERYRIFAEMSCDAVATAHTLTDSIETMLFNLCRGTALKGLCGIPAKREPNIIRPLIDCTRSEIESYCRSHDVPFITDSTNLSDAYMRNHIRHNLIPNIEKVNGGYEKNMHRCISSLQEDEECLSQQSLLLLKESEKNKGYNAEVLALAPSAVRKRALAHILKSKMNKSVENKHIELLDGMLMNGGGRIELGTDLYILRKGDIITFQSAQQKIEAWKSVFVSDKAETPFGVYSIIKCDEALKNTIDKDKIKGELYLSSRIEGDSFTFKKRKITKTLKKLFNELKIPEEKRNCIPVLHDNENVVWVEGVGVNAKYIPDEKTKNIIKLIREG